MHIHRVPGLLQDLPGNIWDFSGDKNFFVHLFYIYTYSFTYIFESISSQKQSQSLVDLAYSLRAFVNHTSNKLYKRSPESNLAISILCGKYAPRADQNKSRA